MCGVGMIDSLNTRRPSYLCFGETQVAFVRENICYAEVLS